MSTDMIFSADYNNKPRDLSDVLSTVIQQVPAFIRLFGNGAPATQIRHEWLEDQVKGGSITFTAGNATTGVLTVEATEGAKARVGQILTLKDDSAVWRVTAVAPTAVTITFLASQGSGSIDSLADLPAGGGVFLIVSEPTPEGSSDGPKSFQQSTTEWNQTQIYRNGVSLSNTSLAIRTYGFENALSYQEVGALRTMSLDMNRQAIFGLREPRQGASPGQSGGLYFYGTQAGGLKVAAAGAKLDAVILNDAAAAVKGEGGVPTTILTGVGQARVISGIYRNAITIAQRDEERGTYVANIRNDIDGTVMTVFVENDIPDNDVWVLDPGGFAVSTLRGALSMDATKPGTDGVERVIIAENTLEFKNAKIRLCRISGLKSSAESLAG